jgi:hypothetical protein
VICLHLDVSTSSRRCAPAIMPGKWRYRRMAIRKALSSPLGRLTRVPLKWPPVADSSARASSCQSNLPRRRHPLQLGVEILGCFASQLPVVRPAIGGRSAGRRASKLARCGVGPFPARRTKKPRFSVLDPVPKPGVAVHWPDSCPPAQGSESSE